MVMTKPIRSRLMSLACFAGAIVRDETKPDGTPRKLMSNDRLAAMGWEPRIELADGIRAVYQWFLENGAQRS